ncbi:MAG: recombinase family protein [Selenomonas sp.]|nr:recombinase family protein [Selenomonas sp.]
MRTIQRIERAAPAPRKRLRVAAYARVSVESERMQHSLSAQVSYYSARIQQRPDWEYAGVYADYGISGTGTAKREAFQRMLADCEAGRIDLVLTKSIQRFARNTVDLLKTVRRLRELGIEVYFEKENIRTLSGEGELMLTILASFAQEESRSISENIKWRVKKRFEQGIPNGHFRIYGYRWEGDELVIVPEEAAIVRRIFQNFLDGKSRLETEREFAAEGITTRSGCRWADSNLACVLRNITYTGNLLLQKEYIEDPITKKRRKNRGELPKYLVEHTHEAIIDPATFDYVQKEMARRKELGPLANKALRTTCFTGKIKCGICGKSYVHDYRNDRNALECWTCSSKKIKGGSCGAKGDIPHKILLQECAAVLGLDAFDEAAFLAQVEKIVVPERRVLVFHMKDGRQITRHWVSTAKKDWWTPERRAQVSAYRKSHPYRRAGASCLTGKIKCTACGRNFHRKTNHGIHVSWRCLGKDAPPLREDVLKTMIAEVMGLPAFDETAFSEQMERIEFHAPDELVFLFKDGRQASRTWVKPKKIMPPRALWHRKGQS